jgi:predicted naringenin-chalcone synthase
VHPGGPRVLTCVAEALALVPGTLDASSHVLAAHGNMSSATMLFILDRMLPTAPGPCLAMAFGPGLTAELALLRRRASRARD